MMTASEIIGYMESLRNEKQRQVLMRFFKTGPGEYGEGDEFLGLKVPQTREVVKLAVRDTSLDEIPQLLTSRWHEVRLCGLLMLVEKFSKLSTKRLAQDEAAINGRDAIVELYLNYAERANNWDLVDLLDQLAYSPCLWKQRMSMVCTWKTTQQGDPSWALHYAEVHLHHSHDLMHKAVGWMLREVGKRCSMELLRQFLELHAHEMPRTALRYAIEQMSDDERKYWMSAALLQDGGDLLGGEVEVAGGIDDRALGDAGNHVLCSTQFADGQRQADFQHPVLQGLQASGSSLLVGHALGVDAPHVAGKASELGRTVLHGALVIGHGH